MKIKPAYLAIPFAIVVIGVAVMMLRKHDDYRGQMLERFCTASKLAIEEDARAFESNDPHRQEEAYERFYEGGALYHSAQSLQYCVDAREIPDMPARCEVDKDWKCLGDIARQIARRM